MNAVPDLPPALAQRAADRATAVQWARDLLAADDWVILDSETTGLNDAEFVQLAIIDHTGAVLFDSLIKPEGEIEPGAARVHGITAEMVMDAPSFEDVYFDISVIMDGKRVVVYNAPFDWGVWNNVLVRAYPLTRGMDNPICPWLCAMLPYARYVGEWNDYRQDYRWQKLPAGDHSALGDCRATLKLIREMAEEDR